MATSHLIGHTYTTNHPHITHIAYIYYRNMPPNDIVMLYKYPTISAMLGWAPLSSRSLAISTCPHHDAQISGVYPSCYERMTYKCTMKDIHYQPTQSSLYTLTTQSNTTFMWLWEVGVSLVPSPHILCWILGSM